MFNINVIDGGDLAARALIYKQPNPSLTQYLADNMNNVLAKVNEYSQSFRDNIQNLYNKFHNQDVITTSKLI